MTLQQQRLVACILAVMIPGSHQGPRTLEDCCGIDLFDACVHSPNQVQEQDIYYKCNVHVNAFEYPHIKAPDYDDDYEKSLKEELVKRREACGEDIPEGTFTAFQFQNTFQMCLLNVELTLKDFTSTALTTALNISHYPGLTGRPSAREYAIRRKPITITSGIQDTTVCIYKDENMTNCTVGEDCNCQVVNGVDRNTAQHRLSTAGGFTGSTGTGAGGGESTEPAGTRSTPTPAGPEDTGSTPTPAGPEDTGSTPTPAGPEDTGSTPSPAGPEDTGSTPTPAGPEDTGSTPTPAGPEDTGSTPTPAGPEDTGSTPTPAGPEDTGSTPTPAGPEDTGSTPTPAGPEGTGSTPTPPVPEPGYTGSASTPGVPETTGSTSTPRVPKDTGSTPTPPVPEPKYTGSTSTPRVPKGTGSTPTPGEPEGTGSTPTGPTDRVVVDATATTVNGSGHRNTDIGTGEITASGATVAPVRPTDNRSTDSDENSTDKSTGNSGSPDVNTVPTTTSRSGNNRTTTDEFVAGAGVLTNNMQTVYIVVGVAVGLILLIIIIVVVVLLSRRKDNTEDEEQPAQPPTNEGKVVQKDSKKDSVQSGSDRKKLASPSVSGKGSKKDSVPSGSDSKDIAPPPASRKGSKKDSVPSGSDSKDMAPPPASSKGSKKDSVPSGSDSKDMAPPPASSKGSKKDSVPSESDSKDMAPPPASSKGPKKDSVPSASDEEKVAFADWMNTVLGEDPFLKDNTYMPLEANGNDICEKCKDGILLCKLINSAVPGTVDERAVNKTKLNRFMVMENNNLVLNSCLSIGCCVVNIGGGDLLDGREHLVFGLIWQIIRIGLLSRVDLDHNPELAKTLDPGETEEGLRELSPEQKLMRWVNYHLGNAGSQRRLTNFTHDVVDSEIYTLLLHQIAPKASGVTTGPMKEPDPTKRAAMMLAEADKINCRRFLSPADVVSGNGKLNLAFTANLFNCYPALEPHEQDESAVARLASPIAPTESTQRLESERKPPPKAMKRPIVENREEKTYRNWINSLGVAPHVNYIYSDLRNGLVIFHLYDQVKPGVVDWKKVRTDYSSLTGHMNQIENGNYAIDLGKELGLKLVGIQGKDILDGTKNLTLGLIWQVMRAYNLRVLEACSPEKHGKVNDEEIIKWANNKLKATGHKAEIKSFKDRSIRDAVPLLELVEAIQPETVDWDNMNRACKTNEERMSNASYAISLSRKLGAKVYALPEDIAEGNQKMIMTMYACLMARDFRPNMGVQGIGSTGRH